MRISDLNKNKVIALPVEGVFIKDLPAKQFEIMFKDADKQLEEENKDFVVKIFKELICDKDGNPFEDLVDVDYDGLTEILSLKTLHDIIYSIPKAVVPAGVDLGNLNETGKLK